MSRKVFEKVVSEFLKSSTPEAILIKGSWGIGKTYSWNKSVQEAKKLKSIALEHYSYVSLFGLKSIDDLRFAIAANKWFLRTLSG
ncbi:MAG: hypothetical protein A2Y33_03880 [Spirochaetes bacterium GWF1_51_8]|nr:MAG: hypothetical protein A2Y33_03880 [Spirochaetes bacterium GWF1_51_8]